MLRGTPAISHKSLRNSASQNKAPAGITAANHLHWVLLVTGMALVYFNTKSFGSVKTDNSFVPHIKLRLSDHNYLVPN